MKKFHDMKMLRNFFIGQILYNPRVNPIVGKLRPKWERPFVVTKILPFGAVEISYKAINRKFKVNGNKLNIFQQNKPITNKDNMDTTNLDIAQPMLEEDGIT